MKKIYQFESINEHRYLNIEAYQKPSEEIVMRIYYDGDEYALMFPKSEFLALCELKDVLLSN